MLRHIPNMLTGLRLAAAPATVGLLATGHFEMALGIFAFAGVSDAADGFLAKRMGVTSRLGRFLDPAADKALLFAALVTLTVIGDVPLWLTLAVTLREVLLMAGIVIAVLARANIVVQPLLIGKAATALQIVYVLVHLVALAFGFGLGAVEPGAAYIVAILTLVSGFSYCGVWWRAMRARPSAESREDHLGS
jgi:cardiolipin synthase